MRKHSLSIKRELRAAIIGATLPLIMTSAAKADCFGARCTSYDFGLPVTITNSTSSPSLTVMGGNVGIGTTSPGQLLDVSGGYVRVTKDYSTGYYLNNTTTGITYGIFNASSVANGFTGLGFFDGSDYRLTTVGPYVGIGTTAPASNLEVGPSLMASHPVVTGATINSQFTAENSTGGFESLILSNGGTNPGTSIFGSSLSFKAATYGATTSKSSGRILSYFDTAGGSDPGYTGAITAFQYPTADNTFTTAMVVRNGAVGIGNTNPTYTLDVTGTLRVSGQAYTTSGDGGFTILSDSRFKTIHGRFERGLADILKINTIRYNYSPGNPFGSNSQKEYVGVTAQNLQSAIPEAVQQLPNSQFGACSLGISEFDSGNSLAS